MSVPVGTPTPLDGGPGSCLVTGHFSEGAAEYRRAETIHAVRMPTAFSVLVESGGVLHGRPGDYLAEDADGGCWPIPAERFEAGYVPVAA